MILKFDDVPVWDHWEVGIISLLLRRPGYEESIEAPCAGKIVMFENYLYQKWSIETVQ